jgi:hypothetical protein
MIKTYVASKSKHWPWWQALRVAGVNICSSWIDADFNHTGAEPSADEWSRHWSTCIAEASAANIVLVYAACDERQMGALCELGAGLASGAQVFLVADHKWSIAHHPRVRSFPNLAAAISAIMAIQAGEKARRAA